MYRHIHFIGIGGIGMSGIAQLFLRRGVSVSGSDVKENSNTVALHNLGARIFIGHHPSQVLGSDAVVYSSAIKEDNPEVIAARSAGLPLLRRAEALALLMQDKTVITVTGSHGKTTTTSLVSHLLLEAGMCPTVAIGGVLRNIDTNAYVGEGNFFVAEADESDGSFLCYTPDYSIITNIDREHLDYYKDFDSEIRVFEEFINQTNPQGCVFSCSDDNVLRSIMARYHHTHTFFGLTPDSHIYADNIEFWGLSSQFDCFWMNTFIARFQLALGGKHNISNALAVIALGKKLGIDIEIIKKALVTYPGAGRRMEIKFKDKNYLIMDDYAHHPTEIRATLTALRQLNPARLIAVFQPHRYTRTQLLLDEFGKSFDQADYVIVTDIYAASEPPLAGVSGECIFERIKTNSPQRQGCFLPKEKIVPYLNQILRPHDLVVMLGAGDIARNCDELVEQIKGHRAVA